MAKVIGFGGIFFKSRDPRALREWYAKHLGIETGDFGASFAEDPAPPGSTLWAPFGMDTGYFAPSAREFMLNFRVEVDPNVHADENGRFGWVMDPEGSRIERWQPPSAKMPA